MGVTNKMRSGRSKGSYPLISPVGEDGVLLEFEPQIAPEINRKVRQLAFKLEQARFTEIIEVVPAFRSLVVYFDAETTRTEELYDKLRRSMERLGEVQLPKPARFVIPTVYGGPYGPDLANVAASKGISTEEVVRLFSTQRYTVYCLGFLCGLANLGGVPEKLHLPRLSTPRMALPAGSVGMAGAQAVVLPIVQPSGFHYLGRTFVSMYDPSRLPPTPIAPGDFVECPAVSEAEAKKWQGRPAGECLVETISGN